VNSLMFRLIISFLLCFEQVHKPIQKTVKSSSRIPSRRRRSRISLAALSHTWVAPAFPSPWTSPGEYSCATTAMVRRYVMDVAGFRKLRPVAYSCVWYLLSVKLHRSVHVPAGVFGQTTGQVINYDYRVPGIYEGANLVNTEFIVDAL